MILVVWLHAEGPFFALISRLTVPAFFMVSGYLYNSDNSFKKFFIRKVHTLYIPFVFWNVLASTLTAALGLIPYTLSEFIKHIVLIFLTVDKDGAVFGGSWFIASLFLISVIFKFIDYVIVRRIVDKINGKLSKFRPQFCVGINLIIFSLVALFASHVTLPFRMSRTFVLGFFYALGVITKEIAKKRRNNRLSLNPVIIKYFIAIVAVGLYVSIASTCYTDLGFNVFENRGLYILEVICGSYVIYITSELLGKITAVSKLLAYVGRHTIDIVLWQFVFFRLVIMLQLYLYHEPLSMITQTYPTYDSSHGWWIVYTVVGVVLSLAFGAVLRKGPWGNILRKIHVVE